MTNMRYDSGPWKYVSSLPAEYLPCVSVVCIWYVVVVALFDALDTIKTRRSHLVDWCFEKPKWERDWLSTHHVVHWTSNITQKHLHLLLEHLNKKKRDKGRFEQLKQAGLESLSVFGCQSLTTKYSSHDLKVAKASGLGNLTNMILTLCCWWLWLPPCVWLCVELKKWVVSFPLSGSSLRQLRHLISKSRPDTSSESGVI